MQRLLTLAMLSLMLVLCSTKNANAQKPNVSNICFSDTYGYVYQFPSMDPLGGGYYYGEGTGTAYPSYSTVKLWINLTSHTTGFGEMHVVNNAPDGCNFSTDSFIYVGPIVLVYKGTVLTNYSGSGTWNNYCNGSVLTSGTWSAAGPCFANRLQLKTNGINPVRSNNNQSRPSLKIAPNPVINHTQLTYTLANSGKVNITIYNAMQQPVKVFTNAMQAAGTYSVIWNTLNYAGSAVPNGIYKVVADMGTDVLTGSIQVVR